MANRHCKTELVLLIIMLFGTIPAALGYESQSQITKSIATHGEIRYPDATNDVTKSFNWFDIVNTMAMYLSAGVISSIVGLFRWFRWYQKHRINKTPVVAKSPKLGLPNSLFFLWNSALIF